MKGTGLSLKKTAMLAKLKDAQKDVSTITRIYNEKKKEEYKRLARSESRKNVRECERHMRRERKTVIEKNIKKIKSIREKEEKSRKEKKIGGREYYKSPKRDSRV